MVGVFAVGRLLSRPAKDGAPATGGGGSTGNNLIWATGNNLTWGTGNYLIWGT